jgi:hypothetical protein
MVLETLNWGGWPTLSMFTYDRDCEKEHAVLTNARMMT